MNSSCLKKISSEHGGALLNVMVAVGLGGIVVAGMTQMITNSMKAQKRVSNDVDKSAIKQMLLDVVDCKETLDHCNGTQPSKVYRHRKDGPELFIKNTGTGSRFGFWTLRANCNGTDDGLIVRAARLKEGKSVLSNNKANFQPDPLSNQTYTWTDYQTLLFSDGVEICTGHAGQYNIQSGWGYLSHTSSWLEQKYFKFPKPFSKAPIVQVTEMGCRAFSKGSPTDISSLSFDDCSLNQVAYGHSIDEVTKDGFRISTHIYHGTGATGFVERHVAYTWIAIE